MSEFAVSGAKIKPLIKLARSAPVPFAFNPDATGGDHLLCMHRRKSPALLGKSAKKEGPSNKVAFGEVEVDGKLMTLTCQQVVPGLAKRMKSYLRGEGIPLNMRVLDADGQLLEEDVEELPDDPEQDAAPEPEQETDGQEEAQPQAEDPAAVDPKALIARLQEVSARVKTAPPEVAAKLTPAVGAAAGQIKAQDYDQAEARVTQLEQVLDKLDAAPPKAPAPEPAPDPNLDRLMKAIDATQAGLDAVQDNARAALAQALDKLREIAQGGDLPRATEGLKSLRARMAGLTQPAPEPEPQAQPVPEPEPEPEVLPERKISIVAFQRSRIVWLDAKRKLHSSLEELRDAIIAQSAGDEDQEMIKAEAQKLVSRVDAFDDRLEDILTDITTTPDGPERNKQRAQAAKLIGEYSAMLGSPFYKNLDDNPFVPLDAVATAQQTLALVRKAVA